MEREKRNLKECEELIKNFQGKLWERDAVLREMRMGLYQVATAYDNQPKGIKND